MSRPVFRVAEAVGNRRRAGTSPGQAPPLYHFQRFVPKGTERADRREQPPRPSCLEHLRRTCAPAVLPRWMPSEEFAPRAPVQGPAGTAALPGKPDNNGKEPT